jgi:membrane-associated protein
MELPGTLFDRIRHLDQTLLGLVREYGAWSYGLLFVVVFCETGLVVTPFLPGDSLLFSVRSGAISSVTYPS